MPRKPKLPQSRRHIFVYDEDWEFLHESYGPGTESRLGVSGAIREIIHAKVSVMQAQVQAEFDRMQGRGRTQATQQEMTND